MGLLPALSSHRQGTAERTGPSILGNWGETASRNGYNPTGARESDVRDGVSVAAQGRRLEVGIRGEGSGVQECSWQLSQAGPRQILPAGHSAGALVMLPTRLGFNFDIKAEAQFLN